MILEINYKNPQLRLIKQVVAVLQEGGVVAYPTDTVYGLGCDIYNKQAIQRIHQIKNQPENKPFSFICQNLKEVSYYTRVTNYAYKTLRRLLPGPYTFILEGSHKVPKKMLTRRKTAGIRIPNHAICLAIVNALGRPLLSTSATDYDGRILINSWEISQILGNQLDLIVDGGLVPGIPSSIISLVDDVPEILREGSGLVDIFYG